MLLSANCKEIQSLPWTVNFHTPVVDMRLKVSKTKMMAVLIPADQHKAAPRGPLRANDQGTEGVRGRINLVGSSFSCLQSLVEVRNIVAYIGQGLPGSCAFDSAAWFWDMASASCRRLEAFVR